MSVEFSNVLDHIEKVGEPYLDASRRRRALRSVALDGCQK
jgi:hypothetical protein